MIAFLLLILLGGAAAAPAPDLVAAAKAGQPPSFAAVLDARFDPAGRARFDAFRDWAATLDPVERAQYYDQLPPGPSGKPRWRERVAFGHADRHGLSRAMSFVADHAGDRAAAQAIWAEAQRAYAAAETTAANNVAKAQVAPRPTAIGRALALRVATDQAWRAAQFDRPHDAVTGEAITWRFWSRLCHVDDDDTTWLKGIVARGEWPLVSRDGAAAANDAWLLAQHADQDPAFQKQVLALIEPLVAKREAQGKHYALLFDRVAIAEHRPQRYGTQFGTGKDGCLAVDTVEDHEGIDARRAVMGLDTLAAYGKRLSDVYHQKVCDDIFATAERSSTER
ncbi:hypothetical protein QH494_14150 [Sphingomonas sp. AR_OL41]|uniref:DUF6624 domain-containing protein n=1 Tax=Sphingomonas sp. AR_OL41 TaxID=3042729 RepID=UPI00247FDDC4|nr:DUF6624 domain-containing protein [Sphingomonas sp. AR_OL41]MDH7973328.1 hypothetical protein [Sphingomonas sp. AR_OL41]